MERVTVVSGDGKKDLGYGNFVGCVPVFFWRGPLGTLLSNKKCEERPTPQIIEAMEAKGAELVELQSNPKIVLDSGDVVYGCQVYWSRVKDDN